MDFYNLVESFIPTFDYISLQIEFVEPKNSYMLLYKSKLLVHNDYIPRYHLYDGTHEHVRVYKEGLLEEVKKYLDKHEVDEIKVVGIISEETCIYKKD
jgi:hypothetical protein